MIGDHGGVLTGGRERPWEECPDTVPSRVARAVLVICAVLNVTISAVRIELFTAIEYNIQYSSRILDCCRK